MIYNDQERSLSRFVRDLVRRKSRQIVGKAGLQSQDADDLAQDILLRLLKSEDSFDPAKAHENVFITTVVERYVVNILRDRFAAKRGLGQPHVSIGEGDECPVDVPDPHGPHEELCNLQIDVAEAIASLPPDLQSLARSLLTDTKADVARSRQIPRTSLYSHIRKLRKHFEDRELRDYL